MEKMSEILPANLRTLEVSGDSWSSTKKIDSSRFALQWARLCAAYPRQETTTATAQVFYEQLSDYTEGQIADAVAGIIATSKWFPSCAEIIGEIKGEFHCPHGLKAAELRMQAARLKSRETMVIESERYSDRRLKEIAEQVAELETRRAELYAKQKAEIEASGLPEAQARLDAVNAQIVEQQKVLTLLRSKIKLFDQARILQADDIEH